MADDLLMTAAEAADELGVDVSTVARLANSGALPTAHKLPGLRGARLFHPDDVAALADERRRAS